MLGTAGGRRGAPPPAPRLLRSGRFIATLSLVCGVFLFSGLVTQHAAASTPASDGGAGPVSNHSPTAQPSANRGTSSGLQDPGQVPEAGVITATPTRILIPTIDVNAPLQKLATDAKGVLQPPTNWTSAGWYAKGVVPGNIGPAVIAGHLDTDVRAAVFVALRFLRPGDPITVAMSNGTKVHFVVTRSAVVKKSFFPTSAIYGSTPDPQLRLITCSEPFDDAQGIYADNLVVYATEAA